MKPVRKIFVSYRREDAAHPAGRIRDWLVQNWQIPREHVFMDVENILPGADFAQEINRAIAQCDAMIVVISPSWLADVNQPGASYPRLEAEAALNHADLKIIPVLAGAPLPTAAQLPPSLHPLLKLNVRPVRADSFDYDLGFVARALGFRARGRSLMGAGLAVVLVAAGLATLSQLPAGNPIYSMFHRSAATPTTSGSSASASQGPLSKDRLTTAFLDAVDVDSEFSRSQPNIEARSVDCSRQDSAATVLGDDRMGISLSRPEDPSIKSRIILIREDLASYQSEEQAKHAMGQFTAWKDRCKTPRSTGPALAIRVYDRTISAQGDATSAAIVRTRIAALADWRSSYAVVAVVRLGHTVCVLAFESVGVNETQGYPSPPDDDAVSRYVAAAVDKLKTLT